MIPRTLTLEQLVAHPANVRDDVGDVTELAASIDQVGILQPLVVMEAPAKPGVFVVLAGHRRLAAARMLRLREVPVVVTADARTYTTQLVTMLVENLQRNDLSSVEKAKAFGKLRDGGMKVADIARHVGMPDSTIQYYIALLDLDDETLAKVDSGEIQVKVAIDAIRDARREKRLRDGYHQTGRPPVVESDHFAPTHPLARAAKAMCSHTRRRKLRGVACGQCFEAVIRADERERARAGVA